jgi:DUF1365 family protein
VKSALFRGKVRHRRFSPADHSFTYDMFLLYLDLSELDEVFKGRWLWSVEGRTLASFRRKDHLGDERVPLDQAVRDLVESRTGRRPDGPIRLLTHPRYYGYVFNPVSFYYCFDREGRRVHTVVAEVDNTPWGERHCYVLDPRNDEGSGGRHRWRFDKEFHVSPFMEMETRYDWRFTDPAKRLVVHMECEREGERFFDATMNMERRPITGRSLAAALLRFPFMTGRVVSAIYLQALKLWWKKVPFHVHPDKRDPAAVDTQAVTT